MKWLGYGVAGLIMLLAIATVAGSLLSVPADSARNAALTKVRQSGMSVTKSARPAGVEFFKPSEPAAPSPEGSAPVESATERIFELAPMPRPKDDTYGRELCKELGQLLNKIPALSPEEEQRVRELLKEHAEVIAEVKAVSELPPTSPEKLASVTGFDKDPYHAKLPNLLYFRTFTNLLALDAYLACIDGKPDEALRTCGSILKLADHLRDFPSLICQMFADALVGITSRVVSVTCLRGGFSDGAVASFYKVLDGDFSREALVRAFSGNTECMKRVFEDQETLSDFLSFRDTPSWQRTLLANAYHSRLGQFICTRDEAIFLEIQAENIRLARLPYYEAYPQLMKMKPEDSALGWSTPITSRADPGLGIETALVQQAKIEVILQQMRYALALMQYKRDAGRYPDTLSELAPKYVRKISKDPFSGEEPGYQRMDDVYALFSVGMHVTAKFRFAKEGEKAEGAVFGKPAFAGDNIVWGFTAN